MPHPVFDLVVNAGTGVLLGPVQLPNGGPNRHHLAIDRMAACALVFIGNQITDFSMLPGRVIEGHRQTRPGDLEPGISLGLVQT